MPELAFFYSLGFLTTLSITVFMLFRLRRRRNSSEIKCLNSNLYKIGLFWSDHQDALLEVKVPLEELENKERHDLHRSMLISGLLLSALSWLGAVFFVFIITLLKFLARSKLEKNLFNSQLVTNSDSLSPHDVRRQVDLAQL
jgi:hypothetical protein